MADYIITDIPEDTMRDFKTACANYQVTMRQEFLGFMDLTIERYQYYKAHGEEKPKTTKKKG